MKIAGLQKLTLLDYPGNLATTIFLSGCNLRCPFCQNVDLIDNKNIITIDEKEVIDYLKEKLGKIEAICITGGEPLLNNDLSFFLIKIKQIGYKIKVDTNGFFCERLKKLLDDKIIDYVAMDIKSGLSNYDSLIGKDKIKNNNIDKRIILDTIKLLLNSDIEYEFRTTCVKGMHEEADFYEIREMIKGAKRYYLQNYRANERIKDLPYKPFEKNEMENFYDIVKDFVEYIEIRGL